MLNFFSAARKVGPEAAPALAEVAERKPAEPALDSRALAETIDLIESDVLRAVKGVIEETVRAAAASGAVTGRLDAIRDRAVLLSGGARAIVDEFQTVAGSSESFVRSANDVADSIAEAAQRAAGAAQRADASAVHVAELHTAVAEIGTILATIGAIAQKTNLLALNATIEAARAGAAGRGFAVVAQEVKALSVASAAAVTAIGERIEALRGTSQRATGAIEDITGAIRHFRPLFDHIGGVAATQREAAAGLSSAMEDTRASLASISNMISEIEADAIASSDESRAARRANDTATQGARDLQRRFSTVVRNSEIGDRRREPRLPVDLPVRIRGRQGLEAARTIDIGRGGALLKFPGEEPAVGTLLDIEIARIGAVRLEVVGRSALGCHGAFRDLSAEATGALEQQMREIEAGHIDLIKRAQATAATIVGLIEAEIDAGRLRLNDLFDTDYRPIPGTKPVQFSTRALERLEAVLPPVQEALLGTDPRMVFCACVDRNGYLPVHNRVFSQPQRPDDVVWNTANSRNRRIFDDRAGLLAARSRRDFLLQSYARDMGGGVTVMMKEIDVPLLIRGRHWGGLRTAYKF